jgi:hypothetical protein
MGVEGGAGEEAAGEVVPSARAAEAVDGLLEVGGSVDQARRPIVRAALETRRTRSAEARHAHAASPCCGPRPCIPPPPLCRGSLRCISASAPVSEVARLHFCQRPRVANRFPCISGGTPCRKPSFPRFQRRPRIASKVPVFPPVSPRRGPPRASQTALPVVLDLKEAIDALRRRLEARRGKQRGVRAHPSHPTRSADG